MSAKGNQRGKGDQVHHSTSVWRTGLIRIAQTLSNIILDSLAGMRGRRELFP
jgi:hypothetical protein